MKDADLKVIGKAKELAKHTYILTTNVDRFPKKVRHSLVDKMQIKCLEIFEALFEANRNTMHGGIIFPMGTATISAGQLIRK